MDGDASKGESVDGDVVKDVCVGVDDDDDGDVTDGEVMVVGVMVEMTTSNVKTSTPIMPHSERDLNPLSVVTTYRC